jgi:hypothetical protein
MLRREGYAGLVADFAAMMHAADVLDDDQFLKVLDEIDRQPRGSTLGDRASILERSLREAGDGS